MSLTTSLQSNIVCNEAGKDTRPLFELPLASTMQHAVVQFLHHVNIQQVRQEVRLHNSPHSHNSSTLRMLPHPDRPRSLQAEQREAPAAVTGQ